MPIRYQIPTHLNVPDKLIIPLFGVSISVTMRQGLILLTGWSAAFALWSHLGVLDSYGQVGHVARFVLPGLLAFVTFVVATLQVAGRYLESWALVLLRYMAQPACYVWKRSGSLEVHRNISAVLEEEEQTHEDE